MSSDLSKWFDVIEQQGEERKSRNEKMRQRIVEQGPPCKIIIPDKDYLSLELRFWKIRGGVVVIEFQKNKANLNYIRQYTDEFVEALAQTKTEG